MRTLRAGFLSLVVAALLVASLFAAGGCGKTKESAEKTPPGGVPASRGPEVRLAAMSARRPAPDFAAQMLDGSRFRLADQKGKVLLVDYWATWCGPCRMTIPHLIDLKNEYGTRGLEVVGISLDQGGPAIVTPFVRQNGINYSIIADPSGQYASLFGPVQVIPTVFLIDKQGRTAARIEGVTPRESIARAVESLLQES